MQTQTYSYGTNNPTNPGHHLLQTVNGDTVNYRYDANGNRIKEQFYDPQNNLKRTINRRYDNAGRLISETGGVRQLTTYSYDTQGNLTHIRQDPNGLNRTVHYRYDALNRLISTTRANTTIGYQYDQRDNLLRVTDPKGLITRYTYNGLNNRLSQDSPDTGMTAYQYDSSGNLISQANALNITTRTTYDALNRPTQQSHQATGQVTQSSNYRYDTCQNGIGRLCRVQDTNSTIHYRYDQMGNRVEQKQQIDQLSHTIGYAYNAINQLTQITYPSNRQLNITRNPLGQVNTLTTTYNNQTQTLANQISYLPFGPLAKLTYGNGLTLTQDHDEDYRLNRQQVSSIMDNRMTYNLVNEITTLTHSLHPSYNQRFQYDDQGRVSQAIGAYGTRDYRYDLNNNRIQFTQDSTQHIKPRRRDQNFTINYTYDSDSNKIQSVGDIRYQHNALGQLTQTMNPSTNFISATHSYGLDNRLQKSYRKTIRRNTHQEQTASYTYNYLNQRIKKLKPDDTTYYHYGLNGQLLVKIQTNGITREHLPLNNQVIAFVDTSPGTSPTTPSTNTIHTRYVHNNHLGAPSKITDDSGNELWAIYYHPFGWQSIQSDQDRDRQLIRYNLHFPGQYHDWESGLHYNWHRYYRSSLGRYITSDPIGLSGGINTYSYVDQNPINRIDPTGLVKWSGSMNVFSVIVGGGSTRFSFNLISECVNEKQGKVGIVAGGFAVGFGANPAGGSTSKIDFEDNLSEIDPMVFQGRALFAGISYAFIGIGYGASAIQLGGATSIGSGHVIGYDGSVSAGAGISTVISSSIESCCE